MATPRPILAHPSREFHSKTKPIQSTRLSRPNWWPPRRSPAYRRRNNQPGQQSTHLPLIARDNPYRGFWVVLWNGRFLDASIDLNIAERSLAEARGQLPQSKPTEFALVLGDHFGPHIVDVCRPGTKVPTTDRRATPSSTGMPGRPTP